jgi:hypothetical protein
MQRRVDRSGTRFAITTQNLAALCTQIPLGRHRDIGVCQLRPGFWGWIVIFPVLGYGTLVTPFDRSAPPMPGFKGDRE